MMFPQLGIIGGVPAPMNDNVASVIMADAQMNVACTISGAKVLGRMCFQMMAGTLVPQAIAASTYGCSRSDSTTLRTRRDTRGNSAMLMATMTFWTEARVSAISAMASRMGGIDISPSITRITTASRLRMRPATTPMNVPRTDAQIATEKPTISETRDPQSTRE